MNQIPAPVMKFQNSANAEWSNSLKVICSLSIASLVFSIIIAGVGVAGLILPDKVGPFTIGMVEGYHWFWVPGMLFITSIIGICAYRNGEYRHCAATTHLVFSIFTILTVIAGLALCGVALVNMKKLVLGWLFAIVQIFPFFKPSNTQLIFGYCGTGVVAAIYLFFLYYSMHSSIMYCRMPKQTLTHDVNVSIRPQMLQDSSGMNYNYLPANNNLQNNYSV
ncbi:uncharacterized protein TRIADDRAFT_64049 [Trichoplax adhaerens]|uniref:Uncharacterized protein n=1 Tax=Trichoplax adhaerens TaxID=10228 RepID=B3S0D9_TRIAD|nr:predicted protein [Trichoplax adhaerens]EDV24363.1 predicted protein [Trichoplax adhaerens]|eukprot:XP_002113889.1 predicted protein [Trichoplax adhaerens]